MFLLRGQSETGQNGRGCEPLFLIYSSSRSEAEIFLADKTSYHDAQLVVDFNIMS
jgi:hypothetical protein